MSQGYCLRLTVQFYTFGLALEVNVDNETGEVILGDLWDYRDDPEGMLYGEGQKGGDGKVH